MALINYEQALAFIGSAHQFGSKLGLENITFLLDLMGNPQEKLKIIHVAGTNGKGSTTAMTASVLRSAGYKTGMYISPFVTAFNERISIDGVMIADEDIAACSKAVYEQIQRMLEMGKNHPTEFEIITAMAFAYFARENCDFVVLEVGLGGRLDATNVISKPLVSVITSISFDHMEYLGDTIKKIAAEKCGIIKENGQVVCYPAQAPEALKVVEDTCATRNASLTIAPIPKNIQTTITGNTFDAGNYRAVTTRLTGEYQAYNAATVLAVIDVLRQQYGVGISNEQLYVGIQNASWPGRFEILSDSPLVIIDGAHNLSGVTVFRDSLLQFIKGKKVHLVMGMLKDKEYKECVSLLAPLCTNLIATDVPDNPRSADAKDLAKYAGSAQNVIQCAEARQAVDMALQLADKQDVVCVAGSLYLISAVRQYIIDQLK